MRVKGKQISFEWDGGNLDKSSIKHGITPKEAEEVFVSEKSYIVPDVKHSQKEERFIILGRTNDEKNLFVVFTLRNYKVRVISARRMHREEVEKYEKAKKDPQI
ncbi:MAG: BrnT family toxin [Patescibacteria group bacterium]